jgi:hypothetical protein
MKMLRLEDLKAGDVVVADAGFTCIRPGAHTVRDCDGVLYVECDDGKHCLDGQRNEDGFLVGLSMEGGSK